MRGLNPSTVKFSQFLRHSFVRDVRPEVKAIDSMPVSPEIESFLREVAFWRSVHEVLDPSRELSFTILPILWKAGAPI
jgi:hypothetical protein